MAKKFVLYVNDSAIKVYHSYKNVFSFYNSYNIEDDTAVDGLLSLIKKYYKWHVYFFIESSEVMSEKKVFDKKNFKDIQAIINNYNKRSDFLISCCIPNDQLGLKKNLQYKEYNMLSIGCNTYNNLNKIITTFSSNKSKIKVVNYVPVCLGISKIIDNDPNTINVLAKIRKDLTYTIDVFYGHSFVLHRDDCIDQNTNIAKELSHTIGYVETMVTNPNVVFSLTIISENNISRDEISSIKIERVNIMTPSEVVAKFTKDIKFGKNSTSELDDSIISVAFLNKCYHTNFVNQQIQKKNTLFKIIPYSYALIGLVFVGLLAAEINNIFVKIPETLQNLANAESEFNKTKLKLDQVKKIALDPEILSYIDICSKMQQIDNAKASYLKIVKILSDLATAYQNNMAVVDYHFLCYDNCYGTSAKYSVTVNGIIFNPQGDYETMKDLSTKMMTAAKQSLIDFDVGTTNNGVTPKVGASYDSQVFNVIISKNGQKK